MTLVMDVTRWIAVRAIRGRTWALDRVFDSPATSADIRTETEREPFIAVYVDDSDLDIGAMPGFSLPEEFDIRLILEAGVASAQRFDAQGNEIVDPDVPMPADGSTVTQLNATDPGLEAQIGFLTRQALQALMSTQTTSAWAELFRMFTEGHVRKIEFRRGGPGYEAQGPKPRYASRITCLHIGPVTCEPPRGIDLEDYPFWNAVVTAFEQDEEYGELGQLLRMHFESPDGVLPDWRIAQKLLFLPREGMRILGVAPYHRTDPEAAILTEAENKETDPGYEGIIAIPQPDQPQ